MRLRNPRIGLAAAALAALIHPLAQASGSVSVELSGLTFNLIDLDPDDGIEPSFTLISQGLDAGGMNVTTVLTAISNADRTQQIGFFIDPQAATQDGVAHSNQVLNDIGISGTARAAEGVYAARISATPYGTTPASITSTTNYGIQSAAGYTDPRGSEVSLPIGDRTFVDLVLSANTRLEINGHVKWSYSVQATCADNCEESYSGAAVVTLFSPEQPNNTLAQDQFFVPVVPGTSDAGEQDLFTAFESGSDPAGVAVKFDASVFANADLTYKVSNPIPEPGTYALVGMGLAAATGVARRRGGRTAG